MSPLSADFAPLRLATKALPLRDRLEQWHEVVGRQLLRIDSEPLSDSDVEFDADITLRALPGMRMATGSLGGSQDRRTRELTHDGNDDVVLLINLSGPLLIAQRRFETVAKANDCTVLTCSEPAAFSRPQPGSVLALFLSRAGMAPLVNSLDDAHGRVLSAGMGPMRLLASYMQVLNELPAGVTTEFGHAISRHALDLAALAIGAREDCADNASRQSEPFVRLRVLKAEVVRNASAPDFSIAKLARRHRISERQIQRLFELDGTTFSEFLLAERLSRAHRVLTNLCKSGIRIGDVAYACGFGDLSYFNRAFRRRFGETPTSVSRGARRSETPPKALETPARTRA